MWIVIRSIRYNFNQIGFYYAIGKNVILVDVELNKAKEINIICDTPLEANQIVEQIDTRTGAQTL